MKFFILVVLGGLIATLIITGCTPAATTTPPLPTAAEDCATPDETQAAEVCIVPGLGSADGEDSASTPTSLADGDTMFLPVVEAAVDTPSAAAATEPPPPTATKPPPTATKAPPTPTPTEPEPTTTLVAVAYEPVTFAVFGDYGLAGQPEADVAALVKSRNPDIILTTGDNNYPAGLRGTIDQNIGQYYHEYIHPYQGTYGEGAAENRFFPTLGNHDWDTGGVQPYLDYFELPGNERYYDFVRGPVHFFAIDSDSREPDGVAASSIQAQWLQSGLAAAEEPWKIVYMHHPAYTSARRGPVRWMQWPYTEWGATAVLAGHDHVYERLEIDGMTYVTTGLGGFGPYNFAEPLPGSLVRFNADYGALFGEATADEIRFEFVTRAGEVVDTFTITRP